jgi:uncharacterized protein YegP (UPF0339 family)
VLDKDVLRRSFAPQATSAGAGIRNSRKESSLESIKVSGGSPEVCSRRALQCSIGAHRRPQSASAPHLEAFVPAKFTISKDSAGKFRFTLHAPNGSVVATSQPYGSKAAAMTGVKSVVRNANGASIDDTTVAKKAPANARKATVKRTIKSTPKTATKTAAKAIVKRTTKAAAITPKTSTASAKRATTRTATTAGTRRAATVKTVAATPAKATTKRTAKAAPKSAVKSTAAKRTAAKSTAAKIAVKRAAKSPAAKSTTAKRTTTRRTVKPAATRTSRTASQATKPAASRTPAPKPAVRASVKPAAKRSAKPAAKRSAKLAPVKRVSAPASQASVASSTSAIKPLVPAQKRVIRPSVPATV